MKWLTLSEIEKLAEQFRYEYEFYEGYPRIWLPDGTLIQSTEYYEDKYYGWQIQDDYNTPLLIWQMLTEETHSYVLMHHHREGISHYPFKSALSHENIDTYQLADKLEINFDIEWDEDLELIELPPSDELILYEAPTPDPVEICTFQALHQMGEKLWMLTFIPEENDEATIVSFTSDIAIPPDQEKEYPHVIFTETPNRIVTHFSVYHHGGEPSTAFKRKVRNPRYIFCYPLQQEKMFDSCKVVKVIKA